MVKHCSLERKYYGSKEFKDMIKHTRSHQKQCLKILKRLEIVNKDLKHSVKRGILSSKIDGSSRKIKDIYYYNTLIDGKHFFTAH